MLRSGAASVHAAEWVEFIATGRCPTKEEPGKSNLRRLRLKVSVKPSSPPSAAYSGCTVRLVVAGCPPHDIHFHGKSIKRKPVVTRKKNAQQASAGHGEEPATPGATFPVVGIIRLIPGDAGRPVTDLASELDYPSLADDARLVLRSLVFRERQAAARDGRWFTVRIMPYRTQANRIDGVVITFLDISTTKALEATLREALAVLQSRSREQDAQLDAAKALEDVLREAQAVLGLRITQLTGTDRRGGAAVPRTQG